MNRPKNLYHISFVGASFSGKSTCLSYCEKHLAKHFLNSDRKITLFFSQEEVTNVIWRNPLIDNTTLHFQLMVLSGQLATLYQASVYAEEHPNEVVFLISDRSTMDGIIDLNAEDQKAIGWNYMCDLYDHFFLFDCCFEHYKNLVDGTSGNSYRKEMSTIDALQLAHKIKSFYLGSNMVDPEKVTLIQSFAYIEVKQNFVQNLLIEYIRKTTEEVSYANQYQY